VYLKALSEEETSNVTLFFQVTPVITLILSLIFLHEPVSIKQYIGFFVILAVSLGMAYKPGEKVKISKAFWYIMLWDLSLAVSIIIVKFVVEQASFTKIFSYESWGVAVGSLLLFVFSKKIRKSFLKTVKTIPIRTLGPAVLVSVLEGTQVFYAIVYGFILMKIAPKVFKEDMSAEGLTKKMIFACLLFFGIWLIY
jgi:drug/metabolite transporter (DMT)-like permease